MSFMTNSIERSNALPIVKVTYDIIFQVSLKQLKVLQIKWFLSAFEALFQVFQSVISKEFFPSRLLSVKRLLIWHMDCL